MQPTTAQQELVRSQLGWKPWSGTLHPGPASRAASCGPALAGVSLEIQVQVGGLGVSVVGEGEELLYGRISGIQVRAVTGVARQTLELAIQQVQVFPFICPESQFVSNAKSGNCLLSSACPSSTGCPHAAVDGSCTAASVEDMVRADRLPAPLTMLAYLPVVKTWCCACTGGQPIAKCSIPNHAYVSKHSVQLWSGGHSCGSSCHRRYP